MTNQSYVYVKNSLKEDVTINVDGIMPDGESSLITTVSKYVEETIPLLSQDVSLVISVPTEMDLKDESFRVKSDVDLELVYSRTDSNLRIRIIANDVSPDLPTTTNIELGEEEPE